MHRAETIMEAVRTAVTGLATTGLNAFRGRSYDLGPGLVPALLVYMGEDEILEAHTPDRLRSVLTVNLDAVVAETATQVETALNQIRAEATVALAADHTLGLANIVELIEEIGAEEPEISGEGDRPTARQRLVWKVTYDRGRADPAN